MPNPNPDPNRAINGVDYVVATQGAGGVFTLAGGGGGGSSVSVLYSQKRVDSVGVEYVYTLMSDGSGTTRRVDTGAAFTPVQPTKSAGQRMIETIVQNQDFVVPAGGATALPAILACDVVVLQPKGDTITYGTNNFTPTASAGTVVNDGGAVDLAYTDVNTSAFKVFSVNGCVLNLQAKVLTPKDV